MKSLWNKKMFGLSNSCIRLSLNIAVLRLTFRYQMVFPFAQLGDWRLGWPEKADLSTEKLDGSAVQSSSTHSVHISFVHKQIFTSVCIFSTWFSTKVILLVCFHRVFIQLKIRHTMAVSFRFTEKLVTDQLVSRALASAAIFFIIFNTEVGGC